MLRSIAGLVGTWRHFTTYENHSQHKLHMRNNIDKMRCMGAIQAMARNHSASTNVRCLHHHDREKRCQARAIMTERQGEGDVLHLLRNGKLILTK